MISRWRKCSNVICNGIRSHAALAKLPSSSIAAVVSANDVDSSCSFELIIHLAKLDVVIDFK